MELLELDKYVTSQNGQLYVKVIVFVISDIITSGMIHIIIFCVVISQNVAETKHQIT